jgi:hypothetical protein
MAEKSHLLAQISTQTTLSIDESVVIDSVALGRLVEEVRNEETMVSRHYNRQHNRHNR